MALIMDVIRSPEGSAFAERNGIEFNHVFVRVKLSELDPSIGSNITVNRLVSSKSADWVRKVDNSKRVAMALGYLRKAIDSESPHRLLALIDALPTRPNGPAARALAASSSASAAVPAPVLDAASMKRMVSSVVRELLHPPCFENGRWEIIAVYLSFGQRSIRRGKVRNIYEILMMFLVHQLLCERSSILSSLLILFFHSYQVLFGPTTEESLTFYPRRSLVNQDALQGTFYFKSAKLTQCWFNFAVSWRR
jgi:hypothetical protein